MEMAAVLCTHERTLRDVSARQPELKQVFERAKQSGKISIRHALHQLAEKNVGAAISLRLQHRLQARLNSNPDKPEDPFAKRLISIKLSDDGHSGDQKNFVL